MDPRSINRRKLCQALAAIVLTALSNPPKRVAAGPVALPALGNNRASGTQRDPRKLVVCILRRQSPGKCVTFLGEREGNENESRKRCGSVR